MALVPLLAAPSIRRALTPTLKSFVVAPTLLATLGRHDKARVPARLVVRPSDMRMVNARRTALVFVTRLRPAAPSKKVAGTCAFEGRT